MDAHNYKITFHMVDGSQIVAYNESVGMSRDEAMHHIGKNVMYHYYCDDTTSKVVNLKNVLSFDIEER